MTGDLKYSFIKRSAVIIKLDINGNFQWGREIGGNLDNEATRIIATSDGGQILRQGK